MTEGNAQEVPTCIKEFHLDMQETQKSLSFTCTLDFLSSSGLKLLLVLKSESL